MSSLAKSVSLRFASFEQGGHLRFGNEASLALIVLKHAGPRNGCLCCSIGNVRSARAAIESPLRLVFNFDQSVVLF